MNRYIVAHWNDPTGELFLEEVEAESTFKALASYLEYPEDAPQTLLALEDYCAKSDQWVRAIQVGSFHQKRQVNYWPFPQEGMLATQ